MHLDIPILFQVREGFIDEEDHELPAFLNENDLLGGTPSMRLLDRFKIYDAGQGLDGLVPFSMVQAVLASPGTLSTTYKAQGLVSSFIDGDFIQEQPDIPNDHSAQSRISVAVTLGSIVSTRADWPHGILIQTSKATYCLQRPAEEYSPLYEKSWICHRLGTLVTCALQYSEIVSLRQTFLNSLPQEAAFEGVALVARDVIGRVLDLEDFRREVGRARRGYHSSNDPYSTSISLSALRFLEEEACL